MKLLKNQLSELSEQFLTGVPMKAPITDRILESFDLSDATDFDKVLITTKTMLNGSVIRQFSDVYQIRSPFIFTPRELAMAIRLINMAHHEKEYLILVDDDLVYIPSRFRGQSAEHLSSFIRRTLEWKKSQDQFQAFKRKFFRSTIARESISV